jgi:hypothetical protein
MEIQAADIKRAAQVEPGTLFYLVGEHQGRPLCIRAFFNVEGETLDQTGRIIPLRWAEEPDAESVVIFTDALRGWAAAIEGARIEVDPSSIRPVGDFTKHDVLQREGRLYFPTVSGKGRIEGMVDAETGAITDGRGSIVAFGKWLITVPSDHSERRTIASSPESDA